MPWPPICATMWARPCAWTPWRRPQDKYRALRTFTAAFGLTPMRYLASLRVERARELLARGASCADAAFQAGFSDQAHLTRAFKERLGVTPGFYQRAVTGKSSPIASRQKAHL